MDQLFDPSNWHDLGALVTLIFGTVALGVSVIRPIGIAIISAWQTGRELSHKEVKDRTDSENAQTQALVSIQVALKESTRIHELQSQVTTDLVDVVKHLKDDLRGVTTAMKAQDTKLDLIHNNIKAIPMETSRVLEPTIATLRTALETGFEQLSEGLTLQLITLGDLITPTVKDMLQLELQLIEERMQRHVNKVATICAAARTDEALTQNQQIVVVEKEDSDAEQTVLPE